MQTLLIPEFRVGEGCVEPLPLSLRLVSPETLDLNPNVPIRKVQVRSVSLSRRQPKCLGLPTEIDLLAIEPLDYFLFPCADATQLLTGFPVLFNITQSDRFLVLQELVGVLHVMVHTETGSKGFFPPLGCAVGVSGAGVDHITHNSLKLTEVRIKEQTFPPHPSVRANEGDTSTGSFPYPGLNLTRSSSEFGGPLSQTHSLWMSPSYGHHHVFWGRLELTQLRVDERALLLESLVGIRDDTYRGVTGRDPSLHFSQWHLSFQMLQLSTWRQDMRFTVFSHVHNLAQECPNA